MANFVISKTQNAAKTLNEMFEPLLYSELRYIQIRYRQILLYDSKLAEDEGP